MPRSLLAAVLGLLLIPIAAPLSWAASTPATSTIKTELDPTSLRSALDAAVAKAEADGFSGSVLVAERGKPLYQRAIGLADRQNANANRVDTRFNLASTGKLFTTVAVLQLVEQGKLTLDAPVGRYLPRWPQAQVREQVTLRHLLTHTSGLGSYFGLPGYITGRAQLLSVSDHLPLIEPLMPAFAPGTDYAYSNAGYLLLGRIVEVTSGQDYYDYIQAHVFNPAGMRDSGYYDRAGKATGVAVGYVLGADGVQDNNPIREWRGGPAGGGYSSAPDLLRFHQALMAGKLLRAQSIDLLLTPLALPGDGGRRFAGLGSLVMRVGDDIAYAHPGGSAGVAAEFWALRNRDLVLVVLANVAPLPGSGQPPAAMALTLDAFNAIATAGGPRLGVGMPRRR